VRLRVRAPTGAACQKAAVVAQVARAVQGRTGLWVDIVTGSAGRLARVVAGQGHTEVWLAEGATVAVSRGTNTINVLLFGLVCVVAALSSLANSFVAALQREPERQILRENGWSEQAIRRLDLACTTLIAGTAGVAALLAVPSLGLTLAPAMAVAVLPLTAARWASIRVTVTRVTESVGGAGID